MGQTTNRSLPYPEEADPADVPTDMRELAEAIDTVFGPPGSGSIPIGIIDAAGDLIVGTAPDAVARLAPGTQGHILTRVAAAPGVGWQAPPSTVIPLSTTLPASPTNGQEAILTDNPADPAWTWRFRYNATSASPYKWEYIGGTPFYGVGGGGFQNTVADTWQAIAGMPAFSAPRSGDYTVGLTAQSFETNDACYVWIGCGYGGTIYDQGVVAHASVGGGLNSLNLSLATAIKVPALPAGTSLGFLMKSSGPLTSSQLTYATMLVEPRRAA